MSGRVASHSNRHNFTGPKFSSARKYFACFVSRVSSNVEESRKTLMSMMSHRRVRRLLAKMRALLVYIFCHPSLSAMLTSAELSDFPEFYVNVRESGTLNRAMCDHFRCAIGEIQS